MDVNDAHQHTANYNGGVLAWSSTMVGIRKPPNLAVLHGGVN